MSISSIYKKGPYHAYVSSKPIPAQATTSVDRLLLAILLALGVLIRLYKLYLPSQVVFDEVHLGGFARDYFRGEFFVDVHPPLVKLAFYWIGVVCGWDGEFEFANIGDSFDTSVPFVAMRLFPAICGIASILIVFKTLRYSCRSSVAFFGALILLVENSIVTQSRFMLLEGPLILGVSLCAYSVKRVETATPFSKGWYKGLIILGLSLGLVVLVKLTGIFTVAWVGILVTRRLWRVLGDLEVSTFTWLKEVFVRGVMLIALPLTVYLTVFYAHFLNLPFNGSGSGAMSPYFKSTLLDSPTDIPVEVHYGSTITIKHLSTMKYLHSHAYNYKSGSQEQQVTLFNAQNDVASEWIVETRHKSAEGELQKELREVKDGDIIRLFHKDTGRFLRVNDVRPPITEHEYANEVSCHSSRAELLGDFNYEFKVRMMSKSETSENNLPMIKLRAAESVFQLVHQGTKCIMFGHAEKLPTWAFGQSEVLCVDEPTIVNTFWFVESNYHPLLVDSKKVVYPKLGFIGKVVQYHTAMFRTNSEISTEHKFASNPSTWPLVIRGVSYFNNYNVFSEEGSQIYLIGNVSTYYWIAILVVVIAFKQGVYLIKTLNPYSLLEVSPVSRVFYDNTFQYLLGWGVNLIPFFYMDRQLFLHHYLPSVLFGILAVSQYVEYRVEKNKYVGYVLMGVIAVGGGYFFVKYSALIYGVAWNDLVGSCENGKILGWDYDCGVYGNQSEH